MGQPKVRDTEYRDVVGKHLLCESPSHISNFESCHFNCRHLSHLFFLAILLPPSGMEVVPDRLFGRLGISLFFALNVLAEFIYSLAGY